ncbi:unnamed protein product [Prunus armeniaca]
MATGNGETGQPFVQSNRAGTRKYVEATGKRELPNHLCSQIGQVAGEIIVGQLCSKHRCTKIFKGNQEWGNWSTTCVVKSGRWLGKSLSDTCVLSTGTRNYVKATENGKTSQPPWQSNRLKATGNEKTGQPHVVKSSKWLRKSLSNTSVLSTGTRKYLKAIKNGGTSQPLVQSNQAGGLRNHYRTPVY